jgi:hypothetical protein
VSCSKFFACFGRLFLAHHLFLVTYDFVLFYQESLYWYRIPQCWFWVHQCYRSWAWAFLTLAHALPFSSFWLCYSRSIFSHSFCNPNIWYCTELASIQKTTCRNTRKILSSFVGFLGICLFLNLLFKWFWCLSLNYKCRFIAFFVKGSKCIHSCLLQRDFKLGCSSQSFEFWTLVCGLKLFLLVINYRNSYFFGQMELLIRLIR